MRLILLLIALCIFSGNAFSQLFINELLASNSNSITDEFLESDDWVEIYNAGSVPVNLAGYYISDDPENLTKYQFPPEEALFVTQGDYLIIWTDNDPDQGPAHTNFRLSGGEGEWVVLTDPDGTTIIDQVQFPPQQTDISYGREFDGDPEWIFFNEPTPDATNQTTPQETQLLFINEVLTNNQNNIDDQANENESWFEIYNPNSFQVNLAGYFISNTDDPQLFEIPATDPTRTTVEADDFIVIWVDGETSQGSNHAGFELPNEAGELTLYGPDGSSLVDSYTFPQLDPDVSYGRTSDGALNSQLFNIPTPRVTNTLVIIEPEQVYINELLSSNTSDILDNVGELEDWFELYNPNDYPVNLAGYYLTDDQENPTKFKISENHTDSTTIQPGDWMLFFADEDQSQGIRHTNFRLNNAGEELALYGPDGFSLADEINFGTMETDVSLGRETDGGPNWVTFTGTTPDASNENGTISVGEVSAKEMKLTIFPNPTSEGKIYFGKTEEEISIHTAQGKLISRHTSVSSLNISNLTAGLYLIKNQSGKVARLVISK